MKTITWIDGLITNTITTATEKQFAEQVALLKKAGVKGFVIKEEPSLVVGAKNAHTTKYKAKKEGEQQ